MLHHVAALVRCHSGGGDRTPIVYVLAQIDRFGCGVIMVCKLTTYRHNLYVPDTMGCKHAGSNLRSAKAQGNF